MKVCICMMQKNEFDLFPLWVEYHGGLFGFSNLYVFDNGSEESMTPILKRAEAKGVNIIYEYATFDDFQDKGTHIAKLIRHKDATDPADFYFPLDCDEFIGIEGNNGLVSIDQAAIANELQKHLNAQEVLLIGRGYDNHPVHPNVFSQKSRRKCFFAKDTCVKISLGFHTAKVKNSDGEKKTSIVYMHMHYKPLALLREHSIQKLVGRVASFSVPQLISHRDQKLRGCHLVDMLFFRNDEDYLRYFEDAFPAERYRNLDGFRGFLNHLQADIQSEWPAVKGSGEILMMKFKPRPPSPGELSMEPACKFTEEQGYGWLGKAGLKQINRIEFGYPDYTHVVHGREPQTFRLRLAPGLYRIEVHCVDPKGVPRKLQVSTDQHASLPLLASYGKAFAKLAFDALLPEQGDIDLVFSSPEEMWSLGELRVSFVNVPRVTQLIQDRLRVDRWQKPATELSGQGQQLYQSWVQSPSCGLAQSQSIVGASHYLDLLETAVTYFLGHQNLSGAIVDPYKGVEFQYATPCFAFAAALVASVKGDKRLLDASVKAFRKAALDLSTRSAADGHEDFYPLPLAHAFRVLSRQIDAELMAEISLPLRDFDPFATYRKPPGGRGGSGSNWNCVALAGHFLLNKFGARSSTSDLQYVEESLLAQGHFFANPNGLYMEGPATYDLFPRVWLSDMLACGYEGARAGTLRDALARAELASLFMQSPTGEWVCGGRSAQHVWADALQCALFEMGSQAAFQDGELVKSGVFKRAARRALAAVLQWRRSSGELQVVKNWTEPNVRHGFESYSSHSQYNLLALTALGIAYEHAASTEIATAEFLTPAESATSLLMLEEPMSTLIAQTAGTHVVVITQPKFGQNSCGIARIQFLGVASQLAQTDNVVANAMYELPATSALNLSPGLAWRVPGSSDANGKFLSIADAKTGKINCKLSSRVEAVDKLEFVLDWALSLQGMSSVREHYSLTSRSLRVEYEWQGEATDVQIQIPIFAGDGRTSSQIIQSGNQIEVAFGGCKVRYRFEGAVSLTKVLEGVCVRNGTVAIYAALISAKRPALIIEAL